MDQYDLAASGARDGLWDWDLVSNRVHFSPRWVSMVGCEEGEVGSSPEEWLERIHSDDQPRVRREIETHLASGARDFDIDHRMRQRNGTYRWMTCRGVVVRDHSGMAIRLKGSHADVTADHVADPLTGLPNRLLFVDRLTRSIERARRNPDFLYAVLLIDLDRPNPEEPAGHATGDPLLTASARRLETCLRGAEGAPFPGDDYVVARLRGSQFALLLEGLSRVGEVHAAAERALAELLTPLQLRGRQVFPRASIGIAVSATGYTRTEDVMRDADAALYRARSLGGNRCDVFDIDLLQSADARLELEADLAQALDRHEFLLFYQPVLEAASNRIVGLEALVRWQHPARGMISPVEFIPIAEKTGFIVPLGNWILREACLQLKAWQESLPIAKDLWVSVNLSSVQFKQPGIVNRVGEVLRDVGLDPSCLMLELTESVVMEDPAAVKDLLMQLRVMGVRIGLDDFGTGHSSLAYLHQFPADFLKVDQSFIRGMEAHQDKIDIVGTVAGLAGQLGLHVIAEGIESDAGLGLIRSQRCEYVQGFLFSRPVDAEAAADLLRNGLSPQIESAPDELLPPAPGAGQRLPEIPRRKEFLGSSAYLYVGLAAVALILMVALPLRVARGPAAPAPSAQPSAAETGSASAVAAAPPVQPSAAEAGSASAVIAAPSVQPSAAVVGSTGAVVAARPVQPRTAVVGSTGAVVAAPLVQPSTAKVRSTGAVVAAPPVRPSTAEVKSTGAVVAAPPETQAPAQEVEPPAPQPAAVTFAVEHRHVFGSCTGVLRVSPSGVSYASDTEKDSFSFKYSQFQSTLGDDTLTIKSDQKTYKFKALIVFGKDGNLSQLRKVQNAIDGFRPK